MILGEVYPGISLRRFLMDIQDILIHKTQKQHLDLSDSEFSISPVLILQLKQQLLRGIPLAVLMGFSEFYGHRFFVDANVLIPRPETEAMVDLLVKSQKRFDSILDVGTGSGIIALTLLDQSVAKNAIASDLSESALVVARINARRLRLEDRCQFILSDRLENISQKFSLIVSNPPYIKAEAHHSSVHSSVDLHEPKLALYLPDQEYRNWFEVFFTQVKAHLTVGGMFLMEGHELEVPEQGQILKSLGFSTVEVLKDFTDRPRYLQAII